ncbi:hypothetical protein RCH12_003702 [Cryobacterium sp. MP_3.1]|uniref:hypothetical protein n=1 Tax=Cryobacterium sp. MP_3.1 TaxID=3071711 RepID=UPI002E096CAA|nr:hypothetical protein [Cryobacterium sp. MP_3.1]
MPNKVTPILGAALLVMILAGCQAQAAAPSAIDPSAYTPEEYQDFSWRSIMGSHPDAVRPDVDVVRVIGNEDFPTIYTDCMLEEGFTVKVNADTSFEATVPPEQQEAFDMAMYVCEAKYPRPAILTRTDDEDAGRLLYAYYRDDLLSCLADLGLTSDPLPSEQTFLQTLNSAERYDPYSSLITNGGVTIETWDKATAQCPQRPDSLTN